MSGDTCHVRIGGLDLADVDEFGAHWRASADEFSGWEGSPALSAETTQRPADDGVWSTRPYLGARAIAIGGTVRAPTHADVHAAIRRLKHAITVTPMTMRVAEDGGIVRTATVRRDGQVMAKTTTSTMGEWSISLIADDPMLYSETARNATLALPNVIGGWSPPLEFPFTIGATVTPNQVQVLNLGDYPARPVVTVNGPVVDPVVWCPEIPREMRFRITLAAGEKLVIDCRKGSVLFNGTNRLHTLLGSSFLEIPPGVSSIRYAGASYNSGSFTTVTWKDTWS